jgi:2-deoxy-D-gluconate 3-dehydrogenase
MSGILDTFSLSGKKAIVTGGARGLGFGIAQGLHDAGAEVVLMDMLDTVEESARTLSMNGMIAHAVRADISDTQSREAAFENAVTMLGGSLDILINAAGIQHRCKAIDFPSDQWERIININLSSLFYMCQLAGKVMLKQGHGRIVNIASMLAFFGGVMIPAYTASKGAVAQLTKALSNEWSGSGVNVNAIAPGYMETDLTATMRSFPTQVEDITKRIPIGRWGNAEDMKGLTIFLSSDASAYISGAVIPIDGGYLAR